jgi:hypothetical protein
MNPSCCVSIILQSRLAKVSTLITNNWQLFWIRLAFDNNTKITNTILGRIPIHLVEVGSEACSDHID